MPPNTATSQRNDDRFDLLEQVITNGLSRLETLMIGFDVRLRNVEQTLAVNTASQAGNQVALATSKADQKCTNEELDKRLKIVEEFLPWMKGIKWLTAVIGLQVILFLWAIFTGAIKLVH